MGIGGWVPGVGVHMQSPDRALPHPRGRQGSLELQVEMAPMEKMGTEEALECQ